MTAHEAATAAPRVPAWLHDHPYKEQILQFLATARPLDDDERSAVAVLLAPAVERPVS